MAFYKISSKENLQIIDRILTDRTNLLKIIHVFIGLTEAPSYSIQDDLYFGLTLDCLGVKKSEINSLDNKKWRVIKTKMDYCKIVPRRTNKAFTHFYEKNFPQDKFSYDPLLEFVLSEKYDPFSKGFALGFVHSPSNFFILHTDDYQVNSDILTEISETEYNRLKTNK